MRTVQRLSGHEDLRTTMVYTHVLQRGPFGVRSPLDAIDLASAGEPKGVEHLEMSEESEEYDDEAPLSE